MTSSKLGFLLLGLLGATAPALAQINDPNYIRWSGATGTEWAVASNWFAPPGGSSALPTSSQVAYFYLPGATSTIGTSRTQTDAGMIRFEGASLTLKSNLTGAQTARLNLSGYQGSLLQTTGALIVEAATSPTIFRVNLAAAGNIDVASTGSLDIRAPLTGTNGFTKTGAGSLSISDTSGLTGTIALQTGTLRLTSASYTTAPLSVSGGTVNLVSGGQTLRNLSGTAGTVTTDAQSSYLGAVSTLTLDQTADTEFAGTIQQASNTRVALNKTGTGKLTLTGNNTYTGGTLASQYATTVQAGTLQLGNGGTSGSIQGKINLASGASLIVNRSDTSAFSNSIDGGSSLTFTGGGTFTSTGSWAALSSVRVSGATLIFNGSLFSSSILVLSGGTLGGSGSVTGISSINLEGGGTVNPGGTSGGTGILTAGALQSSSFFSAPGARTVALDLNGNAAGAGYDRLAINGSVDVSNMDLLISLGFVPSGSDNFFVVVNDGTDSIAGAFTGYAEGATVTATYNGVPYAGRITYVGDSVTGALTGGNDIALFGFAATIPEPSSFALLLAGIGLPLARRRHRSL